jgi:hypothetical protein
MKHEKKNMYHFIAVLHLTFIRLHSTKSTEISECSRISTFNPQKIKHQINPNFHCFLKKNPNW